MVQVIVIDSQLDRVRRDARKHDRSPDRKESVADLLGPDPTREATRAYMRSHRDAELTGVIVDRELVSREG